VPSSQPSADRHSSGVRREALASRPRPRPARDRALDQAQARGALQEAFAERLLADPRAVRARVREALEQCGPAFFDAAWPGAAARITADLRVKTDLRDRQGLGAAVTAVSGAVALAPEGDRIVVDKLQDNATSAAGARVTFIPTVFGSPHLVTVHAPGWRPVVQYPVAEPSAAQPVSLDAVGRRLGVLAHPVRLRLVRTLARGSHTTGELALAWDLTPPEVSRHLAVLRRAELLTAERRGRYVHYAVDPSGADGAGDGPAGGGAAVGAGPASRARSPLACGCRELVS